MKKLFLLSAAALLSASSFAQAQFTQAPLFNAAKSSLKTAKMAMGQLDRGAVAPVVRRTAANGVYYTRPVGTMYTGTTSEGMGYYVPMLVVPPAYQLVFTNQSTNKAATTWTINNTDASQNVDANYNLVWGQTPSYTLPAGNGYYTPVLHSGTNTFNLGETNENYKQYGPGAWTVDSIPDNIATFNSGDAQGYAFGAVQHVTGTDSIPYLLGSGHVTFRDGTRANVDGILQPQNAPATPLYVENIHSMAYTSSNAITGTGTLTLYVIKSNADFTELSDTIATLTATADDVTRILDPQKTSYGNVAIDMVTFRPKTAEGDDAPFVINSPYVLEVSGFNNAGVDVDFIGTEEVAEDATNPNLSAILSADGETWSQPLYNGTLTWNYSFYGGFDNVTVADTLYATDQNTGEISQTFPGMNILRVSADGQTVYTDGSTPEGSDDLGGAFVSTALPFYDADGNANYYADELPEWITDLSVSTLNEEEHTYIAAPVCDPLPSGTSGRAATIHLSGKGVTSSTPIIVLQGDATVADGINSVAVKDVKNNNTDNRIFNLAGQQVSKSYKGIVIENGKKHIQ